MNLWFRVFEKLREATNGPHGHADPTTALEYVDILCGKVVGLFQEREMLRMLLTAKAFDEGVLQGLLERASSAEAELYLTSVEHLMSLGQGIIDWGALAEKPKVQTPAPKRLVSLQ